MNSVTCLVASALLAFTVPALAKPVIGEAAPAFNTTDSDGRTQALADYKGKVVVLEWNNPQCPFVRKHYGAGNMQAQQAEAAAAGVVWLTVNSGAAGKQGHLDAAAAKAYVAEQKAAPAAYLLDGDGSPRTPQVLAFQQQTARLQRAVMGTSALIGETLTRVAALRRAIQETPTADDRLASDARAVELRLRDLQMALTGDPTIGRRQEPSPTSLVSRLSGITGSLWSNSLTDPTGTMRRQYEIVSAEFEKILAQLRPLVQTELKRVEDAAEAAGAPWTSGRIPDWRP